MRNLVTAFSPLPDGSLPAEIVYIPEGKHRINPQSHPKGLFINLPADKGAGVAAAFNTKLQALRANNVQPWFDFEHTRKFPAAGYPTSFRYEAGRGLIAAVDWSGSGKRAIEDRDVRYFSPEFYVDDNGLPDGLPDRGPLGGLVTEPAFREIPPIAASDAEPEPNQAPTMSKLIFAALAISAAHADAEQEAVTAIERLKTDNSRINASIATLQSENAELKKKVEAAENEAKEAHGKRLDDKVSAAVAAGKIAIKDEATKKEVRELLQASEALGDKFIANLPTTFGNLDKSVVRVTAGERVVAGEHAFETKARALVTAGQAKSVDEAFGLVAASDPAVYSDYLATLH